MATWYGIDDITFHYNGKWSPTRITFEGVTDSSCEVVEDTMWKRFISVSSNITDDAFEKYMIDNVDEVKNLIRKYRASTDSGDQ